MFGFGKFLPKNLFVFKLDSILLIIFLIFLISAIGLFILFLLKRYQNPVFARFIRKIYWCLFTIIGIGFVILFFRFEGIPYLSSIHLLITLLLGFLVWASFIVKYRIKGYSKDLEDFKKFVVKEKYLPKPKRKQ